MSDRSVEQPAGQNKQTEPAGDIFHIPVLCEEAVSLWLTDTDGIYVDATIGGGGHSEALLKRLGTRGRLLGIDQDFDAIRRASQRLSPFGKQVALVKGNFVDIPRILQEEKIMNVHGILVDLGVSSYQINTAVRGFSHRMEGPLDMRMDHAASLTADRLINSSTADELTSMFRTYGEERHSRRIANTIVEYRQKNPIHSTQELAALIYRCLPSRFAVKSLSRIFQALRIAVNEELSNLYQLLALVPSILMPDGHWVMIAYHSLEDRPIKKTFRYYCKGEEIPSYMSESSVAWHNKFRELTHRSLRPGKAEISVNPRSRSAKLRAIEKL